MPFATAVNATACGEPRLHHRGFQLSITETSRMAIGCFPEDSDNLLTRFLRGIDCFE
jgi:hypothetical protein